MPSPKIDVLTVVRRMCDTLVHRGPDGSGTWQDESARVALGHRRLSVVDLSQAGAQPKSSASGRYTITFNGEIYNFLSLRSELSVCGHAFHGDGDTEVMLAALEQWGLDAAVARFEGMFAFAVWDAQQQVLSLVRDRIGKKPLYFSVQPQGVFFASELRALAISDIDLGGVSPEAIANFLRYGCVPGSMSIYQRAQKLLPGRILHVALGATGLTIKEARYWNPDDFAPQPGVAAGGAQQVLDQVEALLRDAVSMRMISDVPLGAFLSGGIDSSLVVAMMQELHGAPVNTFCIGFEDRVHDESIHAAAVAQHLGTQHHTLILGADRGLELAQQMSSFYDEPFADVSQIPTVAVSHFAKQQLTVSLSGDGGDELFAGYTRYARADRAWRVMTKMPKALRGVLGSGISCIRREVWDVMARPVEALVPRLRSPTSPGDRLHKLASVMRSASSSELYDHLMSHWGNSLAMLPAWRRQTSPAAWKTSHRGDLIDMMTRQDLLAYLPDDILTKVDRAAMSVSLETRCPLLAYPLVEYALSLPLDYKIRGGQTKWPLRQLLYNRVPQSLVDRPKTGFGVPLAAWLRGPWRDWADSLLCVDAINKGGILDPLVVQKFWQEHLSGVRSWHYYLWDLLMLQSWLLNNSHRSLGSR